MLYKYRYTTPKCFSDIILISDGDKLTGLFFENSSDTAELAGVFTNEKLPVFIEASEWLDEYFSGSIPSFMPKYRLDNLTRFRREVFAIMFSIPYGETTTYGEIAVEIARRRKISKMSAQAVGGAVGHNPLSIVVPCHRVVGANGSLTGYGGGIKNKFRLLELEGHDMRKFFVPVRGTAL